MASTTGRRVVEYWTNKSGGGVIAGDVVVLDTTNDDAFTTSTAGGVTGTVGVALETIASNAAGRVCTAGAVDLVNVNASVTRGNFGKTHTVAKQATSAGSSRTAGAFCQFTTGGTTPKAHLFGIADASTSSSGVPAGTSFPGSPATNDLYYRTDLSLLCYYDGTRWLTTTLYHLDLAYFNNIAATTVYDSALASVQADGDIWLVAFYASLYSSALSGTAYWRVGIQPYDGPTGGSVVGEVNNQSGTNSAYLRKKSTIGALLAASSDGFTVYAIKVSTPGVMQGAAMVSYRLVIT